MEDPDSFAIVPSHGSDRPHLVRPQSQPPEDADDVTSDWEAHAIAALRVRNQGLAITAVGAVFSILAWNALSPAPSVDNRALTTSFRLDLNRATAAELNLLPGVGPKMIQAILQRRKALGGFQHIDQLMSIPGIKEGKLNAMAPFLYVDPVDVPNHPDDRTQRAR